MVHNLDEQGRLRLRIWQAACCCVYFAPLQSLQPLITAIFDMLQVRSLVFTSMLLYWYNSSWPAQRMLHDRSSYCLCCC